MLDIDIHDFRYLPLLLRGSVKCRPGSLYVFNVQYKQSFLAGATAVSSRTFGFRRAYGSQYTRKKHRVRI